MINGGYMNNVTRRNFLKTSGLLVSAMALSKATGCSFEETGKRPNIVCFISDDLDSRYLGCYGGTKYPTPNIDKLAQQGVRFDKATVVSAACTPSRYSMLTGLYPGRCEHKDFLEEMPIDQPYAVNWNVKLGPEATSIAQHLKQQGYYTGFSGKWHLSGEIEEQNVQLPEFPEDPDLDDPAIDKKLQEYQAALCNEVQRVTGFDEVNSVLWANNEEFPVEKLRVHNTEWITKGAYDVIDNTPEDKPFFLWCSTTAVHGPDHAENLTHDPGYTQGGKMNLSGYLPPRESVKERVEAAGTRYWHRSAGVVMLDDHVGAIMDKLEKEGLAENTLFVFIADHNVEPGKITCYEKGVNTPMIARWPGVIKAGTTTDALVNNADLLPTFVEIAKEGAEKKLAIDGQSFLPVLKGTGKPNREYSYHENGYTRGISDGHYKYIALRFPDDLIEQMKSGELEVAPNHLNMPWQNQTMVTIKYYPHYLDGDQLYDLEKDPFEQNNLAYDPEYAGEVKRLRNALDENFLSKFKHPYPLEKDEYYQTEQYAKLVEALREKRDEYIPYWWDDSMFSWEEYAEEI